MHPPRIACKPEAVVITRFAAAEEIYAHDHAGRLFAAWLEGRLYRRALDGRIMEKHTDRSGPRPVRHRRFLGPDEAVVLVDAAAAAAREALEALDSGAAEVIWSLPGPADPERARSLAEPASRFDSAAAERDRLRFQAAYRPVPILPPDRYRSLVVQVTEGCHWNRCTFCSFYRDRPFRMKSADEFAHHVAAVEAYFGKGLSLRRGIFLGDANALLLGARDLLPRLEMLARRLPEHAADVASFIDIFTGHRRDAADLAAVRARGLRRVYLGLESGDDAILAFLDKPQTAAEAVSLAHTARQAGLSVGVIVMAGVGGRAHWRRHVDATLSALEAMRLRAGDLLYVSAFSAPAEGPYAGRARAQGIEALSQDEVEDQVDELLAGATRVAGPGVRAARYDIEEFLY
jgi:hypothetical protein